MDLELKGKVVFIAGSTRGIGLAIARAFAMEGALVAITGRNSDSLSQAAQATNPYISPERIFPICADMTKRDDIRKALKDTAGKFGGLDAAIANVGSGTGRAGWEWSSDDWESGFRTNLFGSMDLAREALPYLCERRGSLTFISSIAGWEAINAPVIYSAAKAAVLCAMKNLSRLTGASHVRINAVLPGNVLFPGGTWERKLKERPEFFEQYVKSEVPLQRFGSPEEVADAAVFLASARASFITGACLVVDGGQTRSF
jgi:3-oxoacyl-[acyl-carrier protein] reductase